MAQSKHQTPMNHNTPSVSCRVCGGTHAVEWLHPREMMFGTREQFDYFRCGDCGCLQIASVPENMGDHYSNGYYSCRELGDLSPRFTERMKRRLLYPRMTRSKLGWNDRIGDALRKVGSGPPLQHWINYLEGPLPLDLPILDVGCGSGEDLLGLSNCGFTRLLGVDPYLKESLHYESGLEIRKCQLADITDRFGLITFHHVFEHLENPIETLVTARNLLEQGGRILIRIPLSDSKACEVYRENWVQLDAPRHITLQTRKSMEYLATKAGLRILQVDYDSSSFQFWGSEQYRNDIPLSDPRSYSKDPAAGVFSKEQSQSFTEDAKLLNEQQKGDQAAFVMVVDS